METRVYGSPRVARRASLKSDSAPGDGRPIFTGLFATAGASCAGSLPTTPNMAPRTFIRMDSRPSAPFAVIRFLTPEPRDLGQTQPFDPLRDICRAPKANVTVPPKNFSGGTKYERRT